MDSLAIEKAAADRLARRDSGNWSAADEAELARWRDQSLAHRIALLRLQTAWQQADRLQALGAGLPADAVPSPGQWRLSTFAASAGAAAPFADVPGASRINVTASSMIDSATTGGVPVSMRRMPGAG